MACSSVLTSPMTRSGATAVSRGASAVRAPRSSASSASPNASNIEAALWHRASGRSSSPRSRTTGSRLGKTGIWLTSGCCVTNRRGEPRNKRRRLLSYTVAPVFDEPCLGHFPPLVVAKARRNGAFQHLGETKVVDQAGAQAVQHLGLDRTPDRSAAARQQSEPDGEPALVARSVGRSRPAPRSGSPERRPRSARGRRGSACAPADKGWSIARSHQEAIDQVEEGLVVGPCGGGDVPLDVADQARLLGRVGELHRFERIDLAPGRAGWLRVPAPCRKPARRGAAPGRHGSAASRPDGG